MHKTLYIDIDEEITSIIDRVRKSAANEIIVIAPKRYKRYFIVSAK